MKKVTVKVENAGEFKIEKNSSLFSLLKMVHKIGFLPYAKDILGAKLNNEIRELSFLITKDSIVKFIDLHDEDGKRIYRRSIHCVLIKAVTELYPQKKIMIKHSISKGIYFELVDDHEITIQEVREIKKRMRDIIKRKIPFVKIEVPLEYAKSIFLTTGREDKFHLIEHREKDYVSLYDLGGTKDYFYGYMVPNTGYLTMVRLVKYKYGVVVVFPDRNDPNKLPAFKEQPKLFNIIREHEIDGHLLNCSSLGELNKIAKEGKIDDLIIKSEYLHMMRIRDLASEIYEKKHKIVFLAGPSSSGKTSTALRIARKLYEMSVRTITISMDDYFLNQIRSSRDEDGDKDLERIEAIDLELFRSNIKELLNGKDVMKPLFDFNRGKRQKEGVLIRSGKKDVVIVEGIHALNPKVFLDLTGKQPFKIYVSTLISMNLDDHNRIPTTDTRLLRRLVRDYKYRNTSPEETLKMWASVRRGEEKNIFPFQENADEVFNTSLYYELSILKSYVEKIIRNIDPDLPEYSEARRMSVFLSYIYPSVSQVIPDDSIIKEFIGGSILFDNKAI